MTPDLVFKSGTELALLVKSKKVSPVEVTKAFLDRSEALNPKTNAYITITSEFALARAKEAEGEIMKGHYRGPLHGIPYAPKDILATKGIRTTNGSKQTADWVPGYESTVTERLNAAGAVMLGKLNLLEYAMGSGVLSGFGPARNPWGAVGGALNYTPGGSSSGTGVALAAYMTPLGVGTDTGGSIRVPAYCCGIVGLKQTYGRVSRYGVTTLAWSLDHAGPMTKTVADCANMLQVMAGPDGKDTTCSSEPVPDYSKSLNAGVKGLRIGVPTNYFFDGITSSTEQVVRAAITKLKDLGATIVEVEVGHADLSAGAMWLIAMAEGAAFHDTRLRKTPELFDPIIRERLEAAKFFPATEYIKAQRVRILLMDGMRQVFEKCDVLAVPAANPAGLLDSPATAGTDVKGPPRPTGTRAVGGSTAIGDLTGNPAIVIPCGFTETKPTLPICIQFYGRNFDEATLLRVSHAYESVTDWHKRRPPLES
jgi:aspartyl-tRNA(Asn)/glutamyl-tRNA(Gln) amidotransferase subunit A